MSESASELGTYDVDRSTHFLFEHKVFQLKGARFALTEDGSTPAFLVELGTLVASLPLATVRGEFEIERDGPDDVLLRIVEKSLRFVKEIRPGDSIPRELLDGSASWSVEYRHRLRAKAHLWAKTIATGETIGAPDEMLEAFVARPEIQEKVQIAIAAIATRMDEQVNADIVQQRLDDLARELAYIEALQERCSEVLAIVPKLNQLGRVYRSDRGILDELSRIRTLLLKPIEMFDGVFADLNNRTQDVAAALAHLPEQIEYIREQRDSVHQSLMIWDPILEAWKPVDLPRSSETEAKIAELYRFIARHYLTAQAWQQGAA